MGASDTVLKQMRYETLKAKGICPACGKRPSAVGGTLCEECHEKRRKYMRKREEEIPAKWPAGFYCYYCGDFAMPGRKVCARHDLSGRGERLSYGDSDFDDGT